MSTLLMYMNSLASRKPVAPALPPEPAAPRLDVSAPHLNENIAAAWNRPETFPDVVVVDHGDAFFVHHVRKEIKRLVKEKAILCFFLFSF